MEARVSSSNTCLLHLKRDVSDKLSTEDILRHLEHLMDAKCAAVENFAVQAATLKVLNFNKSCAIIGTSDLV